MQSKIDAIDVFSGIGGISLALSDIVQTVLYCEVDSFCQQVLVERMLNGDLDRAPIHGDIKSLFPSGSPEMIYGGFPCTDISSIGLQKGITENTASGLFLEIIRIIDQTPSINVVFLENVSNILKCGIQCVISHLVERQFHFCWVMKSASALGAPHQRNRWFCLAVRNDFDISRLKRQSSERPDLLSWDEEPACRVSFRPQYRQDNTFDECWSKRCQTLGNTVVPIVVRHAFDELVKLHCNTKSITDCFDAYKVNVSSDLSYPYPESGIIIDGYFYPLPKLITSHKQNKVDITVTLSEITTSMERYPTPRHGITHPSSVTQRSLHDLPTVLIYCNQSEKYIKENIQSVPDKMHTCVTPNVNYIEWMMGYRKDWTKVTKLPCNKHHKTREEIDYNSGKDRGFSPSVDPPKKHIRYNGMHAFMKDQIQTGAKKDISTIAKLWRVLPSEEKQRYSNIAKTMTLQNQ